MNEASDTEGIEPTFTSSTSAHVVTSEGSDVLLFTSASPLQPTRSAEQKQKQKHQYESTLEPEVELICVGDDEGDEWTEEEEEERKEEENKQIPREEETEHGQEQDGMPLEKACVVACGAGLVGDTVEQPPDIEERGSDNTKGAAAHDVGAEGERAEQEHSQVTEEPSLAATLSGSVAPSTYSSNKSGSGSKGNTPLLKTSDFFSPISATYTDETSASYRGASRSVTTGLGRTAVRRLWGDGLRTTTARDAASLLSCMTEDAAAMGTDGAQQGTGIENDETSPASKTMVRRTIPATTASAMPGGEEDNSGRNVEPCVAAVEVLGKEASTSPTISTSCVAALDYTEAEGRVVVTIEEEEHRRCLFRAFKAMIPLIRIYGATAAASGTIDNSGRPTLLMNVKCRNTSSHIPSRAAAVSGEQSFFPTAAAAAAVTSAASSISTHRNSEDARAFFESAARRYSSREGRDEMWRRRWPLASGPIHISPSPLKEDELCMLRRRRRQQEEEQQQKGRRQELWYTPPHSSNHDTIQDSKVTISEPSHVSDRNGENWRRQWRVRNTEGMSFSAGLGAPSMEASCEVNRHDKALGGERKSKGEVPLFTTSEVEQVDGDTTGGLETFYTEPLTLNCALLAKVRGVSDNSTAYRRPLVRHQQPSVAAAAERHCNALVQSPSRTTGGSSWRSRPAVASVIPPALSNPPVLNSRQKESGGVKLERKSFRGDKVISRSRSKQHYQQQRSSSSAARKQHTADVDRQRRRDWDVAPAEPPPPEALRLAATSPRHKSHTITEREVALVFDAGLALQLMPRPSTVIQQRMQRLEAQERSVRSDIEVEWMEDRAVLARLFLIEAERLFAVK